MKAQRSTHLGVLVALILLAGLPEIAWAKGPGTLKFDEASFEVSEEAGVAVVTVERSGGEDGAVSVHYATGDGTATAGSDYSAAAGTLAWGAGDGATKSFMVTIVNDSTSEGAETVNLTLGDPTGGAAIDSARGTAVILIQASDGGGGGGGGGGDDPPGDDGGDDNGDGQAGSFKFDQRDFSVVERAGMAVISIERSHGESGAASVDYSTEPGTATPAADYTPVSGTLDWASGDESTKVFTIPIVDDGLEEGSETVMLVLSNPTGGAGLGERATAVLHILDDDQGQGNPADDHGRPGTFHFDERSYQVFEGHPSVMITVERSHGEAGAVSVDYATADGSATADLDYTPASGTLFWAAGEEGIKSFSVPILDDDLTEGNETVNLTLSHPTGGADLDPLRSLAELHVLDDDGSTAACVPSSTTLCMLQGRFQIEVEWRSPQGGFGQGVLDPLSDRSGTAWFFNATNKELLVKMLDACQPFGNYWVFFAATTNVDFTLTVTDTATGLVKQYGNPQGLAAAPVQDTFTFPCP